MAVIYKDYANIKVGTTDLQRLYAGDTLIWELESPQPTPTGYSNEYLTFIAKSSGKFQFSGSTTANTISYSTDNGNTWSTPAQVVTINVSSGDTVMWKGNMIPDTNRSNGIGEFNSGHTLTSPANFDARGNVMSLLYGDNFIGQTNLINSYTFRNLFNITRIVSAKYLYIPSSNLTTYCYYQMFNGCPSLIETPSLEATTMVSYCYANMFYACTSLTQMPTLPATTLATSCYASMFENCISLTTAIELPATTLAQRCYSYMFCNCTSLTQAPLLPATTLASACYSSMFRGCTSLTTAPTLPAPTLASSCYDVLFYGCTRLNYIKMLATDISASNCLDSWVNGVSASGTFVKDANATIPSGNNGIPNGWTVQNE